MLTYNDIYELLRKEKYSDGLQKLPKSFVQEFSVFMADMRKTLGSIEKDAFADDVLREKRQYENAMALFKELMLRRKRKILDLVFVAAETGIMKRDFNDMLHFEKDLFEQLVLAIDSADKSLHEDLNGKPQEDSNKMVIANEDIDEFVDMSGDSIGPFKKGELINLQAQVADILVDGEKARFVDVD